MALLDMVIPFVWLLYFSKLVNLNKLLNLICGAIYNLCFWSYNLFTHSYILKHIILSFTHLWSIYKECVSKQQTTWYWEGIPATNHLSTNPQGGNNYQRATSELSNGVRSHFSCRAHDRHNFWIHISAHTFLRTAQPLFAAAGNTLLVT